MSAPAYRILSSGAIVALVEDNPFRKAPRYEFLTCSWLVQVATNNPEPDSIEDTYRIVPCDLRVSTLRPGADIDTALDHTTCPAGHVRHAYGTPENLAEGLAADQRDRDEWI
jgi:hypothetical protein